MKIRIILSMALALMLHPVAAYSETITVSTNNTPLDRKVLHAVADEAFQRIGKEFNLISMPSGRSLQSADAGEIDGEGLRIAGLSAKFPNLVQIDEPFVRISFVAFSKNSAITLNGWESLKPYRLAFVNGWKMFEANAKSEVSIQKVDTPEQMFNMLELDRVDLALYTLADGNAFIKEHGITSVKAVTPALKDVDLYLYLHKKHADIAPEVADKIREMKTDGTYDAILKRALGE